MHLRTLTILALPAALAGQAPAPQGDRLLISTDTLASYLIQGADTTLTGRVIDQLTVGLLDGRRVIHRVYRVESPRLGNSLDSLVDHYETLAPVKQHSRSRRAIELIDFGAGRAQGVIRQPTGDSIRVDVRLPATVYSSSSFDLVLRAAPLAEGWTATVPAFVTGSRTVVEMTARVAGAERVDGVECWRVEAEFMGMSVGFWIAKSTRLLCKQEMRVQAGTTMLFAKPKARLDRRGAT
jgi:hypothetical protein